VNKFRVFLTLALFFVPLSLHAQVVLSEVMYDPAGSEFHEEFIEIFNLSSTHSVDLKGWRFSDGSDSDLIVAVDRGLILQPGQFAVILDASYFDNSTAYDEIIPTDALILTIDNNTFGSAGLSNSTAETVSLSNAAGEVVSQYTYTLGNVPGHSDEKIVLEGSNVPDNWKDSTVLLGTPGAPNSVTPAQYDLAVFAEDIVFSPEIPEPGESLAIRANVHNLGVLAANQFTVQFFLDADRDTMAEAGEELATPQPFAGVLTSGDSTSFALDVSAPASGTHLLFVTVEFAEDEDLDNNVAAKPLLVSFPEQSIRITEIMYSPLSEQAEWFEILNTGSQEVALNRWFISDPDTAELVPLNTELTVPPNGYFVLAQDSTLLDGFAPPPASFAVVNGFPSLANTFDSVILYDLTGHVIDRVDYDESWGGDRGFSLEKINPNLASNDRTNWTTSVAARGGTPGEQNSVFAAIVPSETVLSVAPNPFSPDGDGRDDFAVITYELPLTTAAVNIKIYDIRGRLIRFLVNNMASGARNSVIWDGRDNSGEVARVGIYVIFLQALNAEAGVVKTAKQSLILARQL